MNMWFSDIPDTLSDLLGAARFQHETLVHLVTFYKGKCATQKELIERLRREVEMLKVNLRTHLNYGVGSRLGRVS
jgi:hypothetical protein